MNFSSTQAGGAEDLHRRLPRLHRPVHGHARPEEALLRDGLDVQVLGHRHGEQGGGRLSAAPRGLGIHVGDADCQELRRLQGPDHLRRHQRGNEGAHRQKYCEEVRDLMSATWIFTS